jgi:hypothetical protein
MNYTFCYRLFTSDQKTRMLAAAANTTRSSLATSWANNQGTYPTTWAAPVAATVTPVTAGNYANYLGIMNVSLNGLKIYSLNATQDGGYVDNVKWYNLFELLPNTAYTMVIGLNNSTNNEQVGVWIDYDGNGSFNDANERVFYNSNNAATSSLTVNFTTPSTLSGDIVRMRIMNDFSTIYGMAPLSGSSSSIFAGQAEDYPVLLKSPILPLKLTTFAGRTSRNNNYLEWKTSEEINIKEFQIQRSYNGSVFATIGTVSAKGNSTSETTYNFNDNNRASGSYVYRLKMIDKTDAFTYSNSVNLKIEDVTDIEIIGNPFTNSIKMRAPQNASISLRLMDGLGRTIVQQNIQGQSGIIELPVNTSLKEGVYFLETEMNNVKTIHKLIKTKN